MLKLILKILLLPVIAVLTILQWALVFITGFSSAVIWAFAGICFILGVLGYLTGICSGRESIETLVIGFAVFVIPYVAMWFIERTARMNAALKHFLTS